ncbi:MAG TPA: sigma-70 family RNA polymerase sigma factor [Blastocatellia bacterium]|nr:sigma-70 family RNA polymerase sigma factor [Blastocatellia bacterium]
MLAQARLLSKVERRSPEDIQSIVARACAGDEAAFHAIFNRYSKPVLSFIYHLLSDRSRAEELMQETFVRAYRNLGTMRADTQLSTWLFGIARNVVREAVKEKYKEQRKVSLDEPVSQGLEDAQPLQDERLITSELQAAIQKALSGLTEDYRIVFVLKVLKEKSYEEISAITGASVGKLKTDLHRARLEMKKKLQPYLNAS